MLFDGRKIPLDSDNLGGIVLSITQWRAAKCGHVYAGDCGAIHYMDAFGKLSRVVVFSSSGSSL